MKFWFLLSLVGGIWGFNEGPAKLFCYYDSGSSLRKGLGQLSNSDLEFALPFCSHLVYGYLGIKPDLYEVYSLHEDLDIHRHQFFEVTALKRKFPHLKVLLSIGGDKDVDPHHANKYIQLLEAGSLKQTAFIYSAKSLVRTYGFDGIDLAYQFPKNKPRKINYKTGTCWNTRKSKKVYTEDFLVDPNAEMHKQQFTALVRDLRNALNTDDLLLSLTVLPNVNSTWYFDVPAVSRLVDYVNLAAFDFLTPERNPEEADYSAPLFEPDNQNRLPHYNADFQVSYWLQCPPNKIILGMATYGRAWQVSADSDSIGVPIVEHTEGAAAAGPQSQSAGLLSWPEICARIPNPFLSDPKRVDTATKLYGSYAYWTTDGNSVWVSYDHPNSIAHKASYIRVMGLGGLSLFDLSYDDFRGLCTGETYPLLKAAEYHLQFF